MTTAILRYRNTNGIYRVFLYVLLGICLVSVLPAAYVFGAELGGYVSEKLIGMSGESDSNLVIGGESSSLLDIGMSSIEGAPRTHMNEDEGAFRLTALIPLVMMSTLIFILLKVMASEEMSMFTLLIVAVLIYVFYAFFPGIQEMITGLLGGG